MDKDMHIIEEGSGEPVVHSLDIDTDFLSMKKTIILFLIVIGVGIGTGYILSLTNKTISSTDSSESATSSQEVKKSVGIKDKKTFKDNAEGTLREGGIEDEGQFHLVRPGGDSQNVYLTSTIVDLSQFIGKKVRVWGETFSAQKAGWLMDVGLVEVL